MSADPADRYFGVVHEYRSRDQWGRILVGEDSFVWFHEHDSFSAAPVPTGTHVSFSIQWVESNQFWYAYDVAAVAKAVPVEPAPVQAVQAVQAVQTEDLVAEAVLVEDVVAEEVVAAEVVAAEVVAAEVPVAPAPVEDPQADRAAEIAAAHAAQEPLRHVSGVVVRYFVDKSFGFVRTDSPAGEIFVHQTKITGQGFRFLVPGEPVLVDAEWNSKKNSYQVAKLHPVPGRRTGTVKQFDYQKGYGYLSPTDGVDDTDFFCHHTDLLAYAKGRLSLEDGDAVEFEVGESKGRTRAVRVKRMEFRPPLDRFADMGDENDWLNALAARAEPEPWQHEVRPDKRCEWPILRSYVMHTFARLEQEDRQNPGRKIALGSDERATYASINTGLVTPNQEEIFALFVAKNAIKDGRPWRLDGFYPASDNKMLGRFERLPELADYFDDPAVLLYDRRCELYINVAHIVEDNIDRFPKELQNPHTARAALDAAEKRMKQRVYRNYKAAVPQYNRGSIALLLPLCLQEPNKPDLALVVSRHGKQYRGETVLTLDMAYNNARLLCRPESDWLKP